MSNCTNCYNGCSEVISDRCVRYTGIDIPELGIQTNDTLSSVEQSITNYLVSVLNGTGVKIDVSDIEICSLVNSYLTPCSQCTTINIVDITKALIHSVCDLQTQITTINTTLTTLNSNYTLGCVSGVSANSGTHAIVQAVITKLCSINTDLAALASELHTSYSSNGSQLNAQIAAYLSSLPSHNAVRDKMIPYSAVPYFGSISFFDGSGAGLNLTGSGGLDWTKIYLCNGNNTTPDLRGRMLVGVTSGMLGGTLPSDVNPSVPGNPVYDLSSNLTQGANTITLTSNQIPAHTHPTTVTVTDPGHTHGYSYGVDYPGGSSTVVLGPTNNGTKQTNSSGVNGTGISVSVGVGNNTTTNSYHSNVQPGHSCLYIIYIP